MTSPIHLVAILLLLCSTNRLCAGVSTSVCYVGYVMDSYCIDRGTLLDNSKLVSLNNPAQHSIHCLVDVAACRVSGYEILVPNPGGGGGGNPDYCRGYKLDAAGNDMVITNARAIGMCSTCSGTQMADYKATIKGTIDSTGEQLPLLTVTSVEDASVGCASVGGATVPAPETLLCESGGDQKWQIIHGALMITSWGILLPSGVLCARYMKHRPDSVWFKWHKGLQITGLLIAICGWSIALAKFKVFEAPGPSFLHGVAGMVVMTLGILQPLNAIFRPHPAEIGQEKPYWRQMWEYLHRGSGYTAIFLALITIIVGTTRLSTKTAQATFQALVGAVIVGLSGLTWYLVRDQSEANATDAATSAVSLGNDLVNITAGERERGREEGRKGGREEERVPKVDEVHHMKGIE